MGYLKRFRKKKKKKEKSSYSFTFGFFELRQLNFEFLVQCSSNYCEIGVAEAQKNVMVWLNYICGEYSGTILFLSSQTVRERL